MNSTETELGKIVENLIDKEKDFLVGVQVSGHPGSRKITVQIDSDQGLDINTCSRLSRQLSEIMDEKDIVEGGYTLEVSSPGLDQPLLLARQYKKNIGRILKVATAGKKLYSGRLLNLSEERIELELEKGKGKNKTHEIIAIDLGDIKKATVMVMI